MFGFLKKKLKDAVGTLTTKIDEEAETTEEEIQEEVVEEKPKKKPAKKAAKKATKKEEKTAEAKPEKKTAKTEEKPDKEPAKTAEKKSAKKSAPQKEEKKEGKEQIQEKDPEENREESIEKEDEDLPEVPLPEEKEESVEEQNEEQTEKKEEKKDEKKGGIFSFFKKKKKEESVEESKEAKVTEEIQEDIEKLKEGKDEADQLEEELDYEEKQPKEKKAKKDKYQKEVEKLTKKIEKKSEQISEQFEEEKDEEEPEEQEEKKGGFFSSLTRKITSKKISEGLFEEIFWELEVALLENNAAVEVIEKIKDDLKGNLVGKAIPRKKIEETIISSLKSSVDDLVQKADFDLYDEIEKQHKQNKPYVVCFVGINGSGKTTSIAKLSYALKEKGYTPILAAGDTFRAAAIDQLAHHAEKIGVKIIKHDYNADPAAVAYDAIKHAQGKEKAVVLIDTAGRLHSNTNLMEELHKIVKVSNPNLTLFVGESITGNDCVEQAREFDKMTHIDGVILSKADVDEKGGAALSVSYVLKKPILFLGVGQEYADLKEFDPELIKQNLGLED